jgi:hypothetical protein
MANKGDISEVTPLLLTNKCQCIVRQAQAKVLLASCILSARRNSKGLSKEIAASLSAAEVLLAALNLQEEQKALPLSVQGSSGCCRS